MVEGAPRGRTLLDAAVFGGNPHVVTALFGAGAHPDVDTHVGVVSLPPKRLALCVAAAHEEVARRWTQADDADGRFEDDVDRCSVLHEAAHGGYEQLN